MRKSTGLWCAVMLALCVQGVWGEPPKMTIISNQPVASPETIESNKAVLQKDPQNFDAAENLCGAYGSSDPQQALDYCSKAISLKPEQPSPYYNIGTALMLLGSNEKAVTYLEKSITLTDAKNPYLSIEYANICMARLNLKQTDSAIEDCQKALQLDPDSKLAHGNLGIGYTHKGMYQEALTEFQKDMALNPDTPSTSYTNIGYIYIQLKQYQQAVNTLQKAIEQDPKNIVGQYNLGIAYLDLKDYPNAISHLEKTLQLDPNYHIAHYHLGLSYCYNHQSAKAKYEYQQLLKSDSQNTNQMKAMLDQYCS